MFQSVYYTYQANEKQKHFRIICSLTEEDNFRPIQIEKQNNNKKKNVIQSQLKMNG